MRSFKIPLERILTADALQKYSFACFIFYFRFLYSGQKTRIPILAEQIE